MSLQTHNTTNYVESIFRIHEDKTFQWHKAYNLVNTLNVLIEEDSLYFKNKLAALTILKNTNVTMLKSKWIKYVTYEMEFTEWTQRVILTLFTH